MKLHSIPISIVIRRDSKGLYGIYKNTIGLHNIEALKIDIGRSVLWVRQHAIQEIMFNL